SLLQLVPFHEVPSFILKRQIDLDVTPKAHHEPGKAHAVVPHRKEFIAFPGNFRIDEQEGTLPQVHGDDALENSNLRSRYRSAEPVFCAELLQGTLETDAALLKFREIKVRDRIADSAQPRVAEQKYSFRDSCCLSFTTETTDDREGVAPCSPRCSIINLILLGRQ